MPKSSVSNDNCFSQEPKFQNDKILVENLSGEFSAKLWNSCIYIYRISAPYRISATGTSVTFAFWKKNIARTHKTESKIRKRILNDRFKFCGFLGTVPNLFHDMACAKRYGETTFSARTELDEYFYKANVYRAATFCKLKMMFEI